MPSSNQSDKAEEREGRERSAAQTERRKAEHILQALKDSANYKKSTLFEDVVFLHNALPELNFSSIDVSTKFMDRRFSLPLIIEAMTGGYRAAKAINLHLASAAAEKGIVFGLGSQRAMLENPELTDTYAVKEEITDAFLIGNIGAYQLKKYTPDELSTLISRTELDALAIHLNPLQELIQPEGDKDWEGVLSAIERHAEGLSIPIIFKEVGAGLAPSVIERLKDISPYFDIAGSGGTSWSHVEYMRGGSIKGFEEWGIPTALALLLAVDAFPKGHYVASGGIRSGIDGAKALALGAEMFGAAKPFLQAERGLLFKGKGGEEAVKALITKWEEQLKAVLFLTGFNDVASFKRGAKAWLAVRGELAELYKAFRNSFKT